MLVAEYQLECSSADEENIDKKRRHLWEESFNFNLDYDPIAFQRDLSDIWYRFSH